MRQIVFLSLALLVLSCRRRAEPTVTIAKPVDSAPSVTTVVTKDAAPEVSANTSVVLAPPKPAPTPPTIACTPDARVRFVELPTPTDPNDLNAEPSAGPAGFACSPLKTASSPLELTVAPGTILQFSVETEVVSAGDAGDAPDAPPTYTTAGLPKGAWIDPATHQLKWHARGAEGDVFAFSFAVNHALPEGKRCVTASMVVRISDTDATRRAQAEFMNLGESTGHALASAWASTMTPDLQELVRKARCGASLIQPSFRDADGDGLADAIFEYPYRGDGTPNDVDVFLRRGDGFTKIGRGTGRVEHAADGTTFLVDTTSAGTGLSCAAGVKIAQVFNNRVQIVADEGAQPGLDSDGTTCKSGDGISIDRVDGNLVGFTAQGTAPEGKVTRRTWRWDGKRFARVP